MNAAPQMKIESWLMGAPLALIRGGTFWITEIALDDISPFWLSAARISFAAYLMFVVWQIRGVGVCSPPRHHGAQGSRWSPRGP